MRNLLIFSLTILLTASCTKDTDPVSTSFTFNGLFSGSLDGDGNLVIKTGRQSYSWEQNESTYTLTVRGTVDNSTETVYYSKTGDGFGPLEQERLFFADNSAGYLERYDSVESTWREVNLLTVLIEGSRFVPLKPEKQYSFETFLLWREDKEENGIFRLRIDYYDQSEPGEIAKPFKDYSNMFTIGRVPY